MGDIRKIVQRNKEIVDKIITKLRQQTVYYDYIKQDELIPDQVIDKSKSYRIRVKLLERWKDLTLLLVRTLASTVMLTDLHLNHMNSESALSVN